jgi:hypothetical protein
MFWGWDVFPLLFLYWFENIIIGCFNLLRMLILEPRNVGLWIQKIFGLPFFAVHFGGFTAIHGIFVIAIFGGEQYLDLSADFPGPDLLLRIIRDFQLTVPIALFTVSHGISFFNNYLRKGERRLATLPAMVYSPYRRIIVMHLTLLFGGGLMLVKGSPTWGLVVLIGLKIVLDLVAHLRERWRMGRPVSPTEPVTQSFGAGSGS